MSNWHIEGMAGLQEDGSFIKRDPETVAAQLAQLFPEYKKHQWTPEEDAELLRLAADPGSCLITEAGSERLFELQLNQWSKEVAVKRLRDYREKKARLGGLKLGIAFQNVGNQAASCSQVLMKWVGLHQQAVDARDWTARKQHTFETVAEHLITQGRKSYGVNDTDYTVCAYRGWEGCKCGIGILIPDENYNPEVETRSVRYMDVVNMIDDQYAKDMEFLFQLQQIHDKYKVEAWPYRLEEFAFNQDLDCPQWLVTENPKTEAYYGLSFVKQAQAKLAQVRKEREDKLYLTGILVDGFSSVGLTAEELMIEAEKFDGTTTTV